MSKKPRKKNQVKPRFGAPIVIPRRHAILLDKIQKAITSLSITVDYLREVAKEVQKMGIEKHREQVNLAKVAKKYDKAKTKKKERKKVA